MSQDEAGGGLPIAETIRWEHAALIAAAVNALPGLLDKHDALVALLVRIRIYAERHPWTGLKDAKDYPEGKGLLRDLTALARVEAPDA